jgi:uncharacterized protein (TIGR02246 family)
MTREPNIVTDEKEVGLLYQELLKQWNKRRASEITDLFTEVGNLVGFDGSQINGRSEARSVLSQIFADHQTASYLESLKKCAFSLQMLLSFGPSLAWYRQESRILTPRSTQFRHSLL